jgi:Tol biopolymer transport system component
VDLADAPSGKGGDWRDDGTLLFAPAFNSHIYEMQIDPPSDPVRITDLNTVDGIDASHRFPQFLSGDRFLYLARRGSSNEVRVASLDGSSSEVLMESPSHVEAVGNSLIFVRDGFLMAQPFDERLASLSGRAVPLANRVSISTGASHGLFSATDSGAAIYVTGPVVQENIQLTWVDRRGEVLATLGEPSFTAFDVEVSPTGDRVSVTLGAETAETDVFILDARSGEPRRVTFEPTIERSAIWSPDGRSLAYSSNKAGNWGIYLLDLERGGGGELLLLAEEQGGLVTAESWYPDGSALVYTSISPQLHREIRSVEIATPTESRLLIEETTVTATPAISPDGRWLAYASIRGDEGGTVVFVASLAEPERRWQITPEFGFWPSWSRDGSELYYQDVGGRLVAVEVRARDDVFEWGPPEVLFDQGRVSQIAVGQDRFLIRSSASRDEAASEPPRLLLGWPHLLGEATASD